MKSQKRITKETLKGICAAHQELTEIQDNQAKKTGTSDTLGAYFNKKLQELEKEFMEDAKVWFLNRKK
ncbi:hypothetical protein D1BOALGB6SA_5968 [Olavius sp. associated proteobacterium Delta 1]|nr:hypothetical protein D1BOALGB6SA_5968 [Olavius sp. associated proteobacterium Delta 1]